MLDNLRCCRVRAWLVLTIGVITMAIVYVFNLNVVTSGAGRSNTGSIKLVAEQNPQSAAIIRDVASSFTAGPVPLQDAGAAAAGADGGGLRRVVRDCVTGDVVAEVADTDTPLQPLPLDPLNPSASEEESPADRQRSFQRVFDTRAWGGSRNDSKSLSASGPGSTLEFTQEMIAILHATVSHIKRRLGVQHVTILDIPCGDLAWMHRFLLTRDDVMYTGMDIVPEVIRHHQRGYPAALYPRRRFIHADAVKLEELGSYHLVFSRMMMQHLKNADIHRLLHKISTSGSHYALLTSINSQHNQELRVESSIRFRPVNLELPPYQLEAPICLHEDGPLEMRKSFAHLMGLWKLPFKVHAKCKVVRNTWKHTEHQLYSCTPWKSL